jgi:hypothetical protein
VAYKGQTLLVSCGKGGFTGAKNVDDIPNYMMVEPTRNIIFERNGRRKRGGTALVNASAFAGAPEVIGLSHVKFIGGSSIILAATDDGDIFSGETSLNAAVKATGTVTSNGTNVSDADTVTIDSVVYTFKTTLTPTEGQVLIGASAAESLDNLKLAINRTDPTTNDGVKYKIAAAHTTVEATTNADTVQTLAARTAGTAGNSLGLAKSAVTLTVSAGTLLNGLNKVTLGTSNPYCFEMGENKVFIADGVSIPQIWTGSGRTTAIHEPAADFTGTPVFQFLLHRRGLSQRMAALNSNTLFLSKTYTTAQDMEHFVTVAISIRLDSGDADGLIGMVEVGEEIIVFTKSKAYRLDDSDIDTAKWGLVKCQWNGGVACWRLLIKTPNDLIVMAEDGEVYSILAVNSYGDYKLASLTAPSWIHDWIRENVDLGEVERFHGVYDPALKAVKIFVARQGKTNLDTALLYYPDRDPSEAWMVHDNTAADSGYNASSSTVAPLATGESSIYTGDYKGQIWKLNQLTRRDNAAAYHGGFKTPPDAAGDPRTSKHFNNGRVSAEAIGPCELKIRTWIDDIILPTIKTANIEGSGVYLDDFMLDDDYLAGNESVDVTFKIGKVGKRIQYEFFNDEIGEDFFISSYSTDCKPQGKTEGAVE